MEAGWTGRSLKCGRTKESVMKMTKNCCTLSDTLTPSYDFSERTLEYHENLLKVYRKMENGNKDGNRVFMFRLADKMFDMFIYPHVSSHVVCV